VAEPTATFIDGRGSSGRFGTGVAAAAGSAAKSTINPDIVKNKTSNRIFRAYVIYGKFPYRLEFFFTGPFLCHIVIIISAAEESPARPFGATKQSGV